MSQSQPFLLRIRQETTHSLITETCVFSTHQIFLCVHVTLPSMSYIVLLVVERPFTKFTTVRADIQMHISMTFTIQLVHEAFVADVAEEAVQSSMSTHMSPTTLLARELVITVTTFKILFSSHTTSCVPVCCGFPMLLVRFSNSMRLFVLRTTQDTWILMNFWQLLVTNEVFLTRRLYFLWNLVTWHDRCHWWVCGQRCPDLWLQTCWLPSWICHPLLRGILTCKIRSTLWFYFILLHIH